MGDNFDFSSALSGQNISPLPALQVGVASPGQQVAARPDFFAGDWDLAIQDQLQQLGNNGGQQVAIQGNVVVNVAGTMDPFGANLQPQGDVQHFGFQTPDPGMGFGYPPTSHLQLVDGPLGGRLDTGNTPLSPGNAIPDLLVLDFAPPVAPPVTVALAAGPPVTVALAAGPETGNTLNTGLMDFRLYRLLAQLRCQWIQC